MRFRNCTFLLVLGAGAFAQQYDLLLSGGRLIDPRNGIDAPRAVAVRNGRIAAVAERIDPARAKRVVDVGGLLITPGLVDIHTHFFYTANMPGAWAGDQSIMPDSFSFRTGVTTMVDAGSAGWRNFEFFRATVMNQAQTRVFAFINIAGYGMSSNMVEQDDFDPDAVARLARKHRDVVVGVKAAHYEKPGWTQVDAALRAGELAGIPMMVDFGYFLPERPYWRLVTERLRPGDITTHVYRGPVPWLDEQGRLYSYLSEARRRGVIFDVGHGGGSFVWRNAVPAVAQGFYPDTISTDLHAGSQNAGMIDLPTTMSKFLAMAMPLTEIVARVTDRPAKVIGRAELGHLSPGAVADIAVWRVLPGEFGFKDASGATLAGRQRLQCELTLKDGQVVWDWNGRVGTDYRQMPPDYGVREGEFVVRP